MPPAFYPIKPSVFLYLGFQVRNREEQYGRRCFSTEYRHFRAHFGLAPSTCALLWKAIAGNRYILPPKATPQHLLWALLYLKLYETDEVLADMVGVDIKTFCKWSWAMVEAIAKLKPQVILWSRRLIGDTGKRCKVSADGTDFRILQQYPKKHFYSHKFNGPGLRYEVAVCIRTGEIVWINGPFNCGQFTDLMVFRKGLKQKLLFSGEMCQADGIYASEGRTCICPNEFDGGAVKLLKDDVRARHETVNKRFKQFGILKQVFRQELCKHKQVFEAVAVITQIAIRNGEELYQVEYGSK